ncbi:2384_t:CDS:2 [Funneliformis geosporum]|uniref:4658_t:CDS:1 n=1 Tax=Funneliformis geosporum TaxID=1117311 RepID=A0A9W4SGA8_9GLOM|nr:2384_t:CDS:2 [Funneliformis geosporum]CAI2167459.1 4658_t:CDS:2 [Funneliformis geosporum]
MVSSLRYERYDFPDLSDPTFSFNYSSMASPSAMPIIHHPTPPYNQHHQKDIDMTSEYLAMNGRGISYTDLLTTDNEQQLMEAYAFRLIPPTHATTCSSPESDNYSLFDPKIKMEYDSLDASLYEMSRTLSSESSCPDLSVCPASISSTNPLTPIDSPHDQSPIMTPTILPQYHQHHQQQHMISGENENMSNEVMMQPTKRGRGRRANVTSATMNTGIQLQDPQEFLMTSPSLSSPQKSGKSRGRRMNNKPTKPGTKSFECTYAGCGRIFKRSEHLKRHIRSIHTLERPFHCPHPHCTKRFSRSDNLSQHVRVHRPNGKEKNANSRNFSNFTPYLQTYQTGNLHSTLQH